MAKSLTTQGLSDLRQGIGSFGDAISALKEGFKVCRIGWNGSGMFAYYVPENKYPAQTQIAKSHFGENSMVPYRAYLALKTAQDDVATWSPSTSDALAEDWMVLEDNAVSEKEAEELID